MSPALMEAVLVGGGQDQPAGDRRCGGSHAGRVRRASDTAQNYYIEGLPFGTRGGMLIKYQFPVDGEIHVQGEGRHRLLHGRPRSDRSEQLEVTVDGERVKLFDWDREIKNTTGNGRATERVPVKAGLHTVGVTFLATNDVPGTELNKPFQRTMNTPARSQDSLLSACRPGHRSKAFQSRGRERHGQPSQDLLCPPG